MIPENLKIPHAEINEDGRRSQHPGYIEIRCPKCGKDFVIAASVNVTFCGRPKCREDSQEVQ